MFGLSTANWIVRSSTTVTWSLSGTAAIERRNGGHAVLVVDAVVGELDGVGVERVAVGELEPVAQREGDRLAVGAPLVLLGQGADEVARVADRVPVGVGADLVVDQPVVDVGQHLLGVGVGARQRWVEVLQVAGDGDDQGVVVRLRLDRVSPADPGRAEDEDQEQRHDRRARVSDPEKRFHPVSPFNHGSRARGVKSPRRGPRSSLSTDWRDCTNRRESVKRGRTDRRAGGQTDGQMEQLPHRDRFLSTTGGCSDDRREKLMPRLIALLIAILLCPAALSATAQETPTPDPESDSVVLLPDASAFGPGWARLNVRAVAQLNMGMTMAPDVFREGAVGTYGGPEGARVVAVVLLLTDTRVAVRRGWENATQLFNSYSYQLDYDYNAISLWDALPPPDGCAEAKRFEGISRDFGFPTGITLCAADPDLIVVTVASGGVNDRTGYEAADVAVKAIIEGRGRS